MCLFFFIKFVVLQVFIAKYYCYLLYLHFTLCTGRYLFIESSWPRQTYDRATIVSETIPTTGEGKCVQFWYHMKGNHIGELAVYMRVGFDISESHVWELFGDQQGSSTTNGGWRQGQAPLLSRGKNLEVLRNSVALID